MKSNKIFYSIFNNYHFFLLFKILGLKLHHISSKIVSLLVHFLDQKIN